MSEPLSVIDLLQKAKGLSGARSVNLTIERADMTTVSLDDASA